MLKTNAWRRVSVYGSSVCLFVVGLVGTAAGQEFTRQVDFPGEVFSFNNPLSGFDKGFLMARRLFTSHLESTPNVMVYDRNGKLFLEARVWFEESARVTVDDIAVNSDGLVCASVKAVKIDGAEAFALVLLERPGRIIKVVRTNPFRPRNVCFASDGSLWAFGGQRRTSRFEDYPVFQRFSPEGLILGQYVSRSSFGEAAVPIPPDEFGNDGPTILEGVGDRIYAYSGPYREWLEFTPTGSLIGRWTLPLPDLSGGQGKDTTLGRIAVTSLGEVYATAYGDRGIALFKLNRTIFRWELAADSATLYGERRAGRLYGADGQSLVFGDRTHVSRLIWHTPTR